MSASTCSSCGAPIVWAKSAKTGKAMPLDAKPEKRVIVENGFGRVVDVHTSHFVTCPTAEQHRRARSMRFIDTLALILIVLKLVGAISWSWWWVLSPFWISLFVFVPAALLRRPR